MRAESSGVSVRGAALVLLLGIFHIVSSVRFEVKDEKNITCILADLSVNFLVNYTAHGKEASAQFKLPENAALSANSNCGKENITAPLLAIEFGANNTLSINFTKGSAHYQAAELVFVYNLSDTGLFPNATGNGTREVSSKDTGISADTNSVYKCSNSHLITMGNAEATFHDVKIEAYLNQSSFSKKETPCSEDLPTTTPTHTTVAPTTAPVPPTTPQVGQYYVNGTSGYCLMAKMGLQLNINYTKKDGKVALYIFNIEPQNMTVNGSCTNTSAKLSLSSETVFIVFTFAMNTSTNDVFYLGGVEMNTTLPLDAKVPQFKADNYTLMYLKTSAHRSYKCNAKQTLEITSSFSINTFNLQLQPFDVEENKFGPAVECMVDENGMLVPIVVGAALAGLVLIVLIAYLIGRKRSHAGYQTI
ncbi:lysosome-associated membrane glycoprotein 1 [Discoglossus pictus]